MTEQYQTKQVVTKSQVLQDALSDLSGEDRRSIRDDVQVLMFVVRERGRMRGHRIMFGEAMALELLYEIGRALNRQETSSRNLLK